MAAHTRFMMMATLALGALGFSGARALTPSTPFQYWKDSCGYTGIPSEYTGNIARLNEATALLVPLGSLEQRSDNPAFYRFTGTGPNTDWENTGVPMSGDVPFPSETRLAVAGRTGFLASPNIVITASHSPNAPGASGNFDPYGYWVVFDMRKTLVNGVCTAPDPEHVPAANVYKAKPTSQAPAGTALIADTMLTYRIPYGSTTLPAGVDYAAFYLDRAVPATRRYLRIRDHGHLEPYDNFALYGHPYRLPAKLLYGVGYIGDVPNVNDPQFVASEYEDFYLLEGMSGGPVMNLDRSYVEIGVSGYDGAGCLQTFFPNSIYNPTPYYPIHDACAPGDYPGKSANSHGINQADISYLATLVPRPYMSVTPLADVTYVLTINGSPSPSQTMYTAIASPSETASTTVSAYVATPPAGQPVLVQLGGYSSTLSNGGSTNIIATASVPTGTPCGIYDRYVTIADITHGFADKIRHRFEIGLTDFSVTPDSDSDVYGVIAPSFPDHLEYTLQNTRPTTVTVAVTPSSSWLSFAVGSSSLVTLAPAGQPGSSKVVGIQLTSAAYALANGDYPFALYFEGQGDCTFGEPVQRSGVFHKGYIKLKNILDTLVFPPTPANAPVSDSFSVAAPFCVNDIKLRFNSLTAGIYTGVHWSDWTPSVRIYLDYSGARSVSKQLWNLNPLPAGWFVPSYPGGTSEVIETLLLDRDQNIPPIGIANLNVFTNKTAAGQWSFRLFDDGIQSVGTGILDSWELELHGTPTCL